MPIAILQKYRLFESTSGIVGFIISPSIQGISLWIPSNNGPISIGSYGIYTITPTGNFTAKIKMWGASGGGNTVNNALGGAGGYSTGDYSFIKNQQYTLYIGEGGISATNGRASGGGGGGTALLLGTTNPLMVAGAGGGGYSGSTVTIRTPGAGGGSSGQDGQGSGGLGGTQLSAGAGGVGSRRTGLSGNGTNGGNGAGANGVQAQGGRGYGQGGAGILDLGDAGSGGGGGGYFGGGGGGGDAGAFGGGGGSGFVHPSLIIAGSTTAGNYYTTANETDVERGGSGQGVLGESKGRDGRIIIKLV